MEHFKVDAKTYFEEYQFIRASLPAQVRCFSSLFSTTFWDHFEHKLDGKVNIGFLELLREGGKWYIICDTLHTRLDAINVTILDKTNKHHSIVDLRSLSSDDWLATIGFNTMIDSFQKSYNEAIFPDIEVNVKI